MNFFTFYNIHVYAKCINIIKNLCLILKHSLNCVPQIKDDDL